MKRYIIPVLLCVTSLLGERDFSEDFQVIITPTWKNLENDKQKSEQFGGDWVLVGSFTFKKKSQRPVKLSKLYLHWTGTPIDNLIASLYKKNNEQDEFLPIEDNLVCDGIWNAPKQTIMFKFNEGYNLGLINTFYLVLTIPAHLKPIVQQGSFEVERELLPEAFQASTENTPLALNLDALDIRTHEIDS